MIQILFAHLVLALSSPQDPAPPPPSQPGATTAELERSLAGAERKVELAELGLAIAEAQAEENLGRARLAQEEKAHALEAAERALALYEEYEAPAALAAAELERDQAENRRVEAQADLEGILRIYAEEPEARSKEEIIRRHRVHVAFAERALEAASRKLEKTHAEVEQERTRRAWALEKSRRELELAELASRRAESEAQVKRLEARDALASARARLAGAQEKLERASSKNVPVPPSRSSEDGPH